MSEYSKEWCERNDLRGFHDFSINREFSRLKLGESLSIVCEGYGITQIVNNNNECYVLKNNELIKFDTLYDI